MTALDIWIVTTEYPPFSGGGIATYCVQTVQMLTRAGHRVTVITPDRALDQRLTVESDGNLRVARFQPGWHSIGKRLGPVAALSYEISELVVELAQQVGLPDVLEFQDYNALAYWTLQRKLTRDAALRDVFVAIHVHTPSFILDHHEQKPTHMLPGFWTGEMERFCIAAADLVMLPSQFLWDALAGMGVQFPAMTRLVRNPYEAPKLAGQARAPLQREFVYVGRIQQYKGVPRLIETMKGLWDQGFDVPLRLIGGDTFFVPKQTSMRSLLAARYEMEVRRGLLQFHGSATPSTLPAAVGRPLAVVQSSHFENFPYAVIEALAAGQVVVAAQSGGHREVMVSGREGFLYDPAESSTFEAAARQAADLSDARREEMGQAAAAAVEAHCGYDAVLASKLAAIAEAKAAGQTPRRRFPQARASLASAPRPAAAGVPGLLSVVVPYFNMGAYVGETLASLERSRHAPMEVIVVDDGSTERRSRDALAAIERRTWPFDLRVVRKSNGGLSSARNAGLAEARGEFLAILDPDDLVRPTYYAQAIDLLRTYENVHFVGCWVEYFGSGTDGTLWVAWNPEPPYFLFHNMLNTSGLVCRTATYREVGRNDTDFEYGLEDWDATLRMVSRGYAGVAIPEPLFRYRVRRDSMSRQFNRDKVLYLHQLLAQKHRALYAAHAEDIVGLLTCNGPGLLTDNPTWDHPPVGFLAGQAAWAQDGAPQLDAQGIPHELKLHLGRLWTNRGFRAAVKLFFKMRLHRLLVARSTP